MELKIVMQIVLQISGCMVLANAIKISTSQGAYFQRIGNIRVYEKTTPIVYTFNVPQIISAHESNAAIEKLYISQQNKASDCRQYQEYSAKISEMTTTIQEVNDAIVDELSLIASKWQKRGIQWLEHFSN